MNAQFSPTEIERVKDATPISAVIGPYVTWDRKKTNARRGDWWACCPFHGEKSPSFHCEDTKGRYYCFGCQASGDAIKFLTEFRGLTFSDAMRELGGEAVSIDPAKEREWKEQRERQQQEREAEQELDDDQRRRQARAIFKAGKPIAGTPAETYLLGRGVPAQEWDRDRLRFIASLDLDTEPFGKHPALLAAVTDVADEITAIWRIYLMPDGQAMVGPDGKKLKRGRGPAAGGAVRLGGQGRAIGVSEGVETALGVRALIQGRMPVWAALSTSGMVALELPEIVREVHIFADGDSPRFHNDTGELMPPPGRAAALRLQERCREKGIEGIINEPPVPGMDWLDVWNGVGQ